MLTLHLSFGYTVQSTVLSTNIIWTLGRNWLEVDNYSCVVFISNISRLLYVRLWSTNLFFQTFQSSHTHLRYVVLNTSLTIVLLLPVLYIYIINLSCGKYQPNMDVFFVLFIEWSDWLIINNKIRLTILNIYPANKIIYRYKKMYVYRCSKSFCDEWNFAEVCYEPPAKEFWSRLHPHSCFYVFSLSLCLPTPQHSSTPRTVSHRELGRLEISPRILPWYSTEMLTWHRGAFNSEMHSIFGVSFWVKILIMLASM